eukprot:CAMPEP_0198310902 /NCGR_PEP_ID=MMETSP1450-20131203/2801_1 /TAXON_ID=753684 ORGANISM="Madagascaria erythrocladiodes, Strain CCMP3234" /NCGR_SAMPLE_ID=MMETSP1450 /ASSEMBLY_ACC=CAM_ASM_001115 /LENGTH=195 /DNA_ID=CAMNT_0044013757 /DNA_START=237 /DNA_END=824 /DNA_ORIENTATION=-
MEQSKSCRGGVVVRPITCSEDADCGTGYACRPNGQCAKYIFMQGMVAIDDFGSLSMDGKKLTSARSNLMGEFTYKGACGNLIIRSRNNGNFAAIAMYLHDKTNKKEYRTGTAHGRPELPVLMSKVAADDHSFNKGEAYDFTSWITPGERTIPRGLAGEKAIRAKKDVREVGTFGFPDWKNYTSSIVAYKIELPGC